MGEFRDPPLYLADGDVVTVEIEGVGSLTNPVRALMLFDPATFEPLTDAPWDEAWVRERIREIVADADGAFDETGLWPADEWDAWQTPTPLKALYVGAAGVVWALDALRGGGTRSPGSTWRPRRGGRSRRGARSRT